MSILKQSLVFSSVVAMLSILLITRWVSSQAQRRARAREENAKIQRELARLDWNAYSRDRDPQSRRLQLLPYYWRRSEKGAPQGSTRFSESEVEALTEKSMQHLRASLGVLITQKE